MTLDVEKALVQPACASRSVVLLWRHRTAVGRSLGPWSRSREAVTWHCVTLGSHQQDKRTMPGNRPESNARSFRDRVAWQLPYIVCTAAIP